MIVRKAAMGDIAAIVRMSREFYATTGYARIAPLSAIAVVDMTQTMIDTGVILVADHDGAVIGMVGLMIVPFVLNPAVRTAHEVVWWVDRDAPGANGAGKALLAAVEPACRTAGAVAVQMLALSTSPRHVAVLYERAGYRHSESCFTKEL